MLKQGNVMHEEWIKMNLSKEIFNYTKTMETEYYNDFFEEIKKYTDYYQKRDKGRLYNELKNLIFKVEVGGEFLNEWLKK